MVAVNMNIVCRDGQYYRDELSITKRLAYNECELQGT